jgi:hypothetical protein
MEKYFTADSYKNWERVGKPFTNSKGKLYTKVKCVCDRCHKGVYVTRVENGFPVPHPAFGGVCLKCGGSGFIKEEVRLYTESEYQAMTRRNEQARIKKETEMKARMEAEFAENKSKWLEENGFTKDEYTYVYFPTDSYNMKERLKADGFKFNPNLFWHTNNPTGYETKVIKIAAAQVVEFSAWGKGTYLVSAKEYVNEQMINARPQSTSEWIGEEKEKIIALPVVYERMTGFDSRYGWTNIHRFNYNGNIITWFTKKDLSLEPNTKILLSATIKEHTEFNNEKQTKIIRAKVELNEAE